MRCVSRARDYDDGAIRTMVIVRNDDDDFNDDDEINECAAAGARYNHQPLHYYTRTSQVYLRKHYVYIKR